MTFDEITLHDMSDFPVVRLSGRGLPDGYAPQWAREVEAVLARGTPFVFLFLDSAANETHEDRKLRTLWLKRNKARLAALCRGIVSIEPDRAKRLLLRAQGAALALAFGLTLKIVADRTQAEALARRLLAGDVAADAAADAAD